MFSRVMLSIMWIRCSNYNMIKSKNYDYKGKYFNILLTAFGLKRC